LGGGGGRGGGGGGGGGRHLAGLILLAGVPCQAGGPAEQESAIGDPAHARETRGRAEQNSVQAADVERGRQGLLQAAEIRVVSRAHAHQGVQQGVTARIAVGEKTDRTRGCVAVLIRWMTGLQGPGMEATSCRNRRIALGNPPCRPRRPRDRQAVMTRRQGVTGRVDPRTGPLPDRNRDRPTTPAGAGWRSRRVHRVRARGEIAVDRRGGGRDSAP